MTDEEVTLTISLQPPTQCVLWEHPERLNDFSGMLEKVETYEDNNHLTRSLYKCKECGQLYFYEWWEWVDWDDGNDKMYTTLFPVQTHEEVETIKQTDTFNLMRYYPRLHLDGAPQWNGK